MMQTHRLRYVFMLVVLLGAANPGQAQAPRVSQTILRQSLLAHVGFSGLPADMTIQGQASDAATAPRAFRIQVKGKNKFRYELGTGSGMSVAIFNAGSAWSGPASNLKQLPDHAAIRRPAEIPFLDVLSDFDSPRFQVSYRGLQRVGAATLHHLFVRLNDATPEKRLFRLALNEDVELFIDPGTNLIVRSQRMQAADNSSTYRIPWVLDFSDYRNVGGIMMPFRIVQTIGNAFSGIYQSTLTIQSVLINQGIADSAFQPR